MNFSSERFFLLISFIFLCMLFCGPPDNPFQETSNVNLTIDVPKQPGGFNHCVNDTVRFNVTVVFPHLVQKVSVRYDENGDKDFREISTDSPKDVKLSFAYEYKEKGLKSVKFTITLRSGEEKVISCDTVDIGIKPTIRHEKNLLTVGDTILGKSLILTVDHEKFSKAEYRWFKNLKLLSGQDQQSLIFDTLKKSDEGQYYCIVSTDWGSDQSKTFILSFKDTIDLPKIIKHPQSLRVTQLIFL